MIFHVRVKDAWEIVLPNFPKTLVGSLHLCQTAELNDGKSYELIRLLTFVSRVVLVLMHL